MDTITTIGKPWGLSKMENWKQEFLKMKSIRPLCQTVQSIIRIM